MEPNEHIQVLQSFTETYKHYCNDNKFNRELECLRQQFPFMLVDPQDDDLFVGRFCLPAVGFSPQEYGAMGGIGYYINFDKIDVLRNDENVSPENRSVLEDLVKFWETENTSYKIRAAYSEKLQDAFPSDRWTEDSGIAFPLYRLAGSMLDYKTLLRLGINGLREKIHFYQKKNGANSFYDASLAILDLFKDVCQHYIDRIDLKIQQDSSWTVQGRNMIAVLKNIAENKPATLREAIQLMFLYNTLSGSLNYGRIDDYLGEFLQRDLECGLLSEKEAQACFESLWRLMISRNTPTDGRVIVGGMGRENEATADRVALMAIETTMEVKDILPQLTLRFYEGQNPLLMKKALESIARGNTFPLLYNDDVNVPAVQQAFNIPRIEAEQYVPYGCGEYVINGKSIGTPSGVINLLKALEVTMFNGRDIVTQEKSGIEQRQFDIYPTFDEFFEVYKKQVNYFIECLAEQEALEYKIAGEETPFLFMSLLYDRCIETGKPLLEGGIQYLGGTLETYGNTNASDSLLAIKKIVFDEKQISPARLLEMIGNNFEGAEKERNLLLKVPKYGNNNEEADEMYLNVHHHVCGTTRSMAEKYGLHSYLVVNINNSANTILGRKTAASADGRLAFTSMANGNAATPGMDKSGITSYLNSVAKPNPDIHAGYVQNIKLTPDLLKKHSEQTKALLTAYFHMGGTQLMVNVVNNDDLKRAMHHPEEFPNLIVRVGGFSARFIDLNRDVQLEILNRTAY